MRYMILCAGRGRRLDPITSDKPKPLVEISNSTTILDTHINNVYKFSYIDSAVIIHGYKGEQIQNEFNDEKIVNFQYNPFYNIAGPAGSLWMAHDQLRDEDFIIVNGDTIFGEDVYDKARKKDSGIHLFVSRVKSREKDDLGVELNSQENIISVSKNNNTNIISSGFVAIRGEKARRSFLNALIDFVKNEQELVEGYWHNIFILIDRGNNSFESEGGV